MLAAAVLATAVLATAVLVSGCSAGPVAPDPSGSSASASSASSGSAVSPVPSITIPSDGVSLRTLGFSNGPAEFSLPVGTVLSTSADQIQQVTAVISSPAPAEVSQYLLQVLPTTGFTVGRNQTDAIEFTGYGWTGSFVATGGLSAVTLQPGG